MEHPNVSTDAPSHSLLMVNGSTSHRSYAVFARRGNMLLCIKPNMIMDGRSMGVEETTYIGARLRAAPIGDAFAAEDKASAVVKLGDHKEFERPEDAFPEIDWEKTGGGRASCQVGVFLRGTVEKNPEALMKKFKEGDILMEMASYLFSLVPADATTVCAPRDLRRYLDVKLTPQIEALIGRVKAKMEFVQTMEENIGVFGIQSAIIKKLHAKHSPQPQDTPVGDKEDEGGEDDHEEGDQSA